MSADIVTSCMQVDLIFIKPKHLTGMESLNDPMGSFFVKKILAIVLKPLEIIIRTTVVMIGRSIIQKAWWKQCAFRCRHLLNGVLYPAIILCFVLLLAITGQKVYYNFFTDLNDREITLTLDNGHVIPIRVMPSPGMAYIYLNTDSILFALKNTEDIDGKGTTVLNVPAGQPPVLARLSDGTLAHVNVASTLRFPTCFTRDKREVTLEGEAYFEVSANAQQLFTVRTKGVLVNALGTKFNVNNFGDNGKAQISLLEGSILVQTQKKVKTVMAGQTIIVDRKNGQLSAAMIDKRVMGWREGIYFFDGESLDVICKNASRLYGTTILIEKKQLAGLHFSGAINRKQILQIFLNYLKDTSNINYDIDSSGRVHLR